MAAKREGKKKPGGQTKRNEVTEAKILAVLEHGPQLQGSGRGSWCFRDDAAPLATG